MNKIDIVPKELDADGKALTFQEVEGFLKETADAMKARVKNIGMDEVCKCMMMLIILCQKLWNEKEESKRECDVHVAGHELVRAFVQYCNDCERGCPMGCVRRRGDVQGLLTPDSWKCGSVLQCFAGFALSRHVDGKDNG